MLSAWPLGPKSSCPGNDGPFYLSKTKRCKKDFSVRIRLRIKADGRTKNETEFGSGSKKG